jgi:membrane protein YqaA with SNARE-associated domain
LHTAFESDLGLAFDASFSLVLARPLQSVFAPPVTPAFAPLAAPSPGSWAKVCSGQRCLAPRGKGGQNWSYGKTLWTYPLAYPLPRYSLWTYLVSMPDPHTPPQSESLYKATARRGCLSWTKSLPTSPAHPCTPPQSEHLEKAPHHSYTGIKDPQNMKLALTGSFESTSRHALGPTASATPNPLRHGRKPFFKQTPHSSFNIAPDPSSQSTPNPVPHPAAKTALYATPDPSSHPVLCPRLHSQWQFKSHPLPYLMANLRPNLMVQSRQHGMAQWTVNCMSLSWSYRLQKLKASPLLKRHHQAQSTLTLTADPMHKALPVHSIPLDTQEAHLLKATADPAHTTPRSLPPHTPLPSRKAKWHTYPQWLYGFVFLESIVLPLPPDPLFLGYLLGQSKAYKIKLSLYCMVASSLGGLVSYAIGAMWGTWVLTSLACATTWLERVGPMLHEWGWLMIIGKSFIPFPYKAIAVVSGIVQMPWIEFFLASCLARGLRFGAGALLTHRYGDKVEQICQKSCLFRKKHALSRKLWG